MCATRSGSVSSFERLFCNRLFSGRQKRMVTKNALRCTHGLWLCSPVLWRTEYILPHFFFWGVGEGIFNIFLLPQQLFSLASCKFCSQNVSLSNSPRHHHCCYSCRQLWSLPITAVITSHCKIDTHPLVMHFVRRPCPVCKLWPLSFFSFCCLSLSIFNCKRACKKMLQYYCPYLCIVLFVLTWSGLASAMVPPD